MISAEAVQAGMQAALNSASPNFWVTTSRNLTEKHWQVLSQVWAADSEL